MSSTVIVVGMALLGVLGRTLVPYLQTLKDKPETPFDRRFLLPAIASSLMAIIGLPLILAGLPDSAWLATDVKAFVLVFVGAWGLTDIGRALQKQSGG